MLTNDKKDICVLNIVKTGAGVFANFRNYTHFDPEMLLGICANGVMYKKSVVCNKSNGYDFKLANDFDLNGNIACVLASGGKVVVWGEQGINNGYKYSIMQYLLEETNSSKNACIHINSRRLDENTSMVIKEETRPDLEVDDATTIMDSEAIIDNIENETLEQNAELDDVVESSNCAKIDDVDTQSDARIDVYAIRDSDEVKFLSKEDLFDADDSEVNEVIDAMMEEGDTFYDMIREQIDALFDMYPEEEKLSSVVPNSRWVRVDYENNGNEYVMGLIYDMEMVKYVAYGVPSSRGDDMPEVLQGYSQWLPLDPNMPDGDGYYVMFQDAITGNNVKLD